MSDRGRNIFMSAIMYCSLILSTYGMALYGKNMTRRTYNEPRSIFYNGNQHKY